MKITVVRYEYWYLVLYHVSTYLKFMSIALDMTMDILFRSCEKKMLLISGNES